METCTPSYLSNIAKQQMDSFAILKGKITILKKKKKGKRLQNAHPCPSQEVLPLSSALVPGFAL